MLNHILASFAHFTALPFGKLKNIPAECKAKVFDFWSLVGWFTGGSMAIVYILASRLVSHPVDLMLAIAARIAITAGREEKGLKTLSAKAGIDGSIVLIVYFLLMFITLKESGHRRCGMRPSSCFRREDTDLSADGLFRDAQNQSVRYSLENTQGF